MASNDNDDPDEYDLYDDIDDKGEGLDLHRLTLCSACDSDLVDETDESGKRWRVCPLAESEPIVGHVHMLMSDDDDDAPADSLDADDLDDDDLDDDARDDDDLGGHFDPSRS